MKGIYPVEKGVEITIEMRVIANNVAVWWGELNLLSRSKNVITRNFQRINEINKFNQELSDETITVNLSKSLGLSYAKVSGDFNPHHLWPFTAKLLGYKKPIAHGMWTLSKAIAIVCEEGNVKTLSYIT